MAGYSDLEAACDEADARKDRAKQSAIWRNELADILDQLGTIDRTKPLTFKNLDELIFQLRKSP